VILGKEDFKNFPNDKELGRFARLEYLKQIDKSLVDHPLEKKLYIKNE
tara:strand:- start:252 stop:395 length:144 start_codon:yes stop_codon:yes gene_type:complete